MRPHEALVGRPIHELKTLNSKATHQHRKGGLYRDLGIAQDCDTKEPYEDQRGVLRAWQHVYPYEQKVILRPVSEDNKFTRLA